MHEVRVAVGEEPGREESSVSSGLECMTDGCNGEPSEYQWCPKCEKVHEAAAVAEVTAELTKYREAVGLLTTLAPDMVMNAADPLAMAKEIERYVTGQRDKALAENNALREENTAASLRTVRAQNRADTAEAKLRDIEERHRRETERAVEAAVANVVDQIAALNPTAVLAFKLDITAIITGVRLG